MCVTNFKFTVRNKNNKTKSFRASYTQNFSFLKREVENFLEAECNPENIIRVENDFLKIYSADKKTELIDLCYPYLLIESSFKGNINFDLSNLITYLNHYHLVCSSSSEKSHLKDIDIHNAVWGYSQYYFGKYKNIESYLNEIYDLYKGNKSVLAFDEARLNCAEKLLSFNEGIYLKNPLTIQMQTISKTLNFIKENVIYSELHEKNNSYIVYVFFNDINLGAFELTKLEHNGFTLCTKSIENSYVIDSLKGILLNEDIALSISVLKAILQHVLTQHDIDYQEITFISN